MDDISTKSVEYQSLETLLMQKSPSARFQQLKERETKELLDAQSNQSLSDKTANNSDKMRVGSSVKTASQFHRTLIHL